MSKPSTTIYDFDYSGKLLQPAKSVVPPKDPENGIAYLHRLLSNPTISTDAVAYFKAITSVDNPDLEKYMGSLADSMSPQQFSDYCSNFADGVQYARQHSGIQPTAIFITDDEEPGTPYANYDTLSIRLPRQAIKDTVDMRWIRQGKTEPFILSANNAAYAYGIEEGCHIADMVTYPELSGLLLDMQKNPLELDGEKYDSQPLEYRAMQLVHQGLQDRGVTTYSPIAHLNVEPDDLKWAQQTLRDRAATLSSDPARLSR